MERGFTRIIVIMFTALIFASSAFTAQFLPLSALQPQQATAGQMLAEQSTHEGIINPESLAFLPLAQIYSANGAQLPTLQQEPAEEQIQPVLAAADEKSEEKNAVTPQKSNKSVQTAMKPAVSAPAAVATATATEKQEAAATSPYTLGASREFGFLSTVIVKNTGASTASDIRIQVPLVTADSLYYSRKGESFSIEPAEITLVNGTRTGVFHLGNLEAGQEIRLIIHTSVGTNSITFHANYKPEDSSSLDSYLQATKGIESNDSAIVNLAAQLTASLETEYEKARAITKWVAASIRYDANAASRNSGALAALQSRAGVCEDYAKLCAALSRAAGIPARVVYGYTDNGNNWPASGTFSLRGYRHAWVEFYLAGYGWAPADPTRSRSSKLYFGTLPHNRYIVQNYNNPSMKGSYSGGKIAIEWLDSLE